MSTSFRRDRIVTGDRVFHRHRVGIPGPKGHTIDASDWSGIQNRMASVEIVASAMNKYPLGLGGNRWISPQSHGLGGTPQGYAIGPQEAIWAPIFVSQSFSSHAMCVEVTTPQAVAQLRLGLYDKNRQLIKDFGTCDASTAGLKVVESSTAASITTGMSFLVVQCNNIASVQIKQLTGGLAMYHSATMVPIYALRETRTYGPMPATLAQSGIAAMAAPLLGLRLD